jgi:hypothetical protein
MLRLKLLVNSVKKCVDNEGKPTQEEVCLSAVYSNEGANKQWSKWTPSGRFDFTISNPDAMGKLLPGQFVFADLSLTDKDSL